MDLLIKNARLVDETIDFEGDLYIKNGFIEKIDKNIDIEGVELLDLKGKLVMPSFVDMHTHFRDPGYSYKEDLKTGSEAAIRAGYSFVNLMGNTKPISSGMEVVNYVSNSIEENDLIDMHQTVSITRDFDGEDLSHLDGLDGRVKCISDDGFGVLSNIVMYEAMKWAKENDVFILSHPEDKYISKIDDRLSENLMTLRDLSLSHSTGARLHMAHISTKEIVDYMRFAKARNNNLSCEVTPHHISLYSNSYKVNPPIREKEDVEALIEAIKDGTIDMIATDHAPHTVEDKKKGAPGISGIETSFTICYTELVRKNHISLNKLSEIMSANPSRLIKINKGRLEKGYDGDLVVLDLDVEKIIDSREFLSMGKNTPLDGMKYYGDVLATIVAGKIKYSGGL